MGLSRRYTLTLVREDISEGYVVKEYPQIICRFQQSENELRMSTYLNENTVTEMIVDKLCIGIKQELRNPNQALKKDDENKEIKQTIIPLCNPTLPTNFDKK